MNRAHLDNGGLLKATSLAVSAGLEEGDESCAMTGTVLMYGSSVFPVLCMWMCCVCGYVCMYIYISYHNII